MTRPAPVFTNSRRVMRAWELMSDIPPLQNRGEWEWYHAVRTASAACAVRYHSPPPTQLRQLPDRQLPDPLPGEREDRVAHGRRRSEERRVGEEGRSRRSPY